MAIKIELRVLNSAKVPDRQPRDFHGASFRATPPT
jgi:hypothetical protein